MSASNELINCVEKNKTAADTFQKQVDDRLNSLRRVLAEAAETKEGRDISHSVHPEYPILTVTFDDKKGCTRRVVIYVTYYHPKEADLRYSILECIHPGRFKDVNRVTEVKEVFETIARLRNGVE